MMKTKTRFAKRLVVVTCALVVTQSALAFYNPSTGRWLSRDPIEERGGANINGFTGNNLVNQVDDLGLTILCRCPEEYFAELGLVKGVHYKGNGDTYSAIPGAFNPGNEIKALIVWRMLLTKHVFKAQGLRVDQLKEHVSTRKLIVDHAAIANFNFDPKGKLTAEQEKRFAGSPDKFFDEINGSGVGLGCQKVTMIIFESGNKWSSRDIRDYDGIWIPGDWGYIRNKAFERNPRNWRPGFEGENVIHTGVGGGKDDFGELFWGHFIDGQHPSFPERSWFNDIKYEWPQNGSINGEAGDPEWKSKIKIPGRGLSANYH